MPQFEAQTQQRELAEQRMGRTPEERLWWVVKFTQQDLDSLRPEERTALGYDLRMLSSLGWGPPQTMKSLGGPGFGFPIEVGPMSEADLRALQAGMIQRLQRLLQGYPWDIPAPARLFVSRTSAVGATKAKFQVGREGG